MRCIAWFDDDWRSDFDRCGRRSGDRGGMHRLGGFAGFRFDGGRGVVNGLLRCHVSGLAATDGGRAGFGFGRVSDRYLRSDNRCCSWCGSALPATRSRGSRCRRLGLTGALLALPSGPDP